jgi:CubicO group peptidase (beta-lactamase class C family)
MPSVPPSMPSQRPHTARELGIMQGFPPRPEKRPTSSNWDLPPFNRWSFQNVRALLPTVDVDRGTGPVQDLPSAHQDVSGVKFTALDGTTKTIKQMLTETYTDGFLIMHRGQVITEQYFNDMHPRSLHLAQSVSKSLVGTLAGVLHGEGKLDMDAPLADRIPELAYCGYGDATLGQVLDMQTGVRFVEDYGLPDSDMTRIDIASGWRPPHPGEPVPAIRDVIQTLQKERPHGERFEYRSIETDMLAWVLERETGTSLAKLMSDRIWSKIGADRDGYFTVDHAGTALADGGFNATLRDFTRFGLMMLQGGRVGDKQIVPKVWVESCRTGEAAKFNDPYLATSPNGAYRRQWWVHDVDRGDYMARGVFGQLIYIDPEADFLAVKLSTWPDYLIHSFGLNSLNAVIAIRDGLTAT